MTTNYEEHWCWGDLTVLCLQVDCASYAKLGYTSVLPLAMQGLPLGVRIQNRVT